jgi:hypothetical protein
MGPNATPARAASLNLWRHMGAAGCGCETAASRSRTHQTALKTTHPPDKSQNRPADVSGVHPQLVHSVHGHGRAGAGGGGVPLALYRADRDRTRDLVAQRAGLLIVGPPFWGGRCLGGWGVGKQAAAAERGAQALGAEAAAAGAAASAALPLPRRRAKPPSLARLSLGTFPPASPCCSWVAFAPSQTQWGP